MTQFNNTPACENAMDTIEQIDHSEPVHEDWDRFVRHRREPTPDELAEGQAFVAKMSMKRIKEVEF